MSENRLGRETSPYLLQHKDNPVHWRAWGPEALAEAKATGKPILLSVGYAACHWCHVMAHESFEDAATAAVMNDLFINIKVDREERPDIDAIYMGALHRLGQQGGWPLTMFLDSDARPFWGGTYFPKRSQWGRPAFVDVLRRVAEVHREEPDKVASSAAALIESLSAPAADFGGPEITDPMLKELTGRMARLVDPVHGGLTGAPKFPQWSLFWLLWRGAIRYGLPDAKAAVVTTLANIAQGGIYDHLGGGFARYSVDERWLVPHFEKMLYDNALLIDLMTEVWRETGNPLFKVRIEETIAWLLREMVAEGGGFAASLDADSEGEEGKFYVWTEAEVERVLGPENAGFFGKFYGITPEGNWEGRTILNRLGALELGSDADERRLADLRAKLLAARSSRVRPGWDDKVLADWNGLAIAALAKAAQVFDRPDWLAAAERGFAFVAGGMSSGDRLAHAARGGRTSAPGTASDYSNMIWGALRLYQATANASYLAAARRWTETVDRHFWQRETGGYALSADDTADVIVRLRSAADDATPNANGIMVSNLAALAVLTGEEKWAERGRDILRAFAGDMARNLLSHTGLLTASMDLAAPHLIAIIEDESGDGALWAALTALSIPGALEFRVRDDGAAVAAPILQGKKKIEGKPTAYVCIGPQCSAPIGDPDELGKLLRDQRLAR